MGCPSDFGFTRHLIVLCWDACASAIRGPPNDLQVCAQIIDRAGRKCATLQYYHSEKISAEIRRARNIRAPAYGPHPVLTGTPMITTMPSEPNSLPRRICNRGSISLAFHVPREFGYDLVRRLELN